MSKGHLIKSLFIALTIRNILFLNWYEGGIEPELARQKSEDGIIQIQGALVLVRVINDNAPFKGVLERLPQLLLGK